MTPDKQLKVTTYAHLNRIAQKGQILLAGSSLCEFFPVAEIARHFGFDKTIYNRGIGKKISDRCATIEELEQYALEKGDVTTNTSGRQEYLENILNRIIFA